MIPSKWILFSFLMISGLSLGTGQEHDDHDDHGHHEGHVHHAPHGGTLVVFGEEFAHLELVLEEKTGKLTGYVLDGEAENAIRLQQKEIKMSVGLNKEEKFGLSLTAISNELTGETVGDTSEFRGQSDRLKGVHEFKAVINAISIRGKAFENIQFQFPEGNETTPAVPLCCDYVFHPVFVDLKLNPNQIEARVQSDAQFWLGEILNVPALEKLPGKNWPEKYQEAAKEYVEKSFKLNLDGQRVQLSSFQGRFVQDIFQLSPSKVVFDFVYDINTTDGKILSGQSQFFAEHKKKPDERSSVPKEFSTQLTVYGKTTKHYDLPLENASFQISLKDNLRSETQATLDKFKTKAVELVQSPPVLLIILVAIIYFVRRKFSERH